MKKFLLAFAAVAAMVVGLGAAADAYPPSGVAVTVSPAAGGPGHIVTVTANCTPGETVTFTLVSSTDSAVCSAAGTATGTVTAPTAPGTYTGSVVGSVSGSLGSFTVTVQAAQTGSLPATGSNGTSTMTMVAAGLLVVGLGLFCVATMRRRHVLAAA